MNDQLFEKSSYHVNHQRTNHEFFFHFHKCFAKISHFVDFVFFLKCEFVEHLRSLEFKVFKHEVCKQRQHFDIRHQHEKELQKIEKNS